MHGKDDAISQKVIKRLLRYCLVNYLPVLDVFEKHFALECASVVGEPCSMYHHVVKTKIDCG